MSIQGEAWGGQLRDLFLAYNAAAGSAVVDMSISYGTRDQYHEHPAGGDQIRKACTAINAKEGIAFLDVSQSFNWSTGSQLKDAEVQIELIISASGPVWIALPSQNAAQGAAWTLDLNDYVTGVTISAFAIDTGALPTGITLDVGAAGTFSGTVTDASGSGSVTFDCTDANGTTTSGTLSWIIGA